VAVSSVCTTDRRANNSRACSFVNSPARTRCAVSRALEAHGGVPGDDKAARRSWQLMNTRQLAAMGGGPPGTRPYPSAGDLALLSFATLHHWCVPASPNRECPYGPVWVPPSVIHPLRPGVVNE